MKEYKLQNCSFGIMPRPPATSMIDDLCKPKPLPANHMITGHTMPPLGRSSVGQPVRFDHPVRIENTFDEYARRIWDDLSADVERYDPIMRKMVYFLLRHKYNISIDRLDDQIDKELRQSYKAETK